MSEHGAIQAADQPRTVDSLTADLHALGVREGTVLLVHASLSSIGWVVGGAQAVILALTRVLGETGTLVMPAYCTDNTDPRFWQAPPIPEAWWQTARDNMPAFDPQRTPTREMGKIAETFRSMPGVRRSSHPATSFCACGRLAEVITENHTLEFGFGEMSPLARIYDAHGQVLLLGVGHERNSSLHLAEQRSDWPRKQAFDQSTAMLVNGERKWVTFKELVSESQDFEMLGASFDAAGSTRVGKVGSATAKLMSQTELVDFGVTWIRESRK